MRHLCFCGAAAAVVAMACPFFAAADTDGNPNGQGVHPYAENPFYWAYNGEPMVLIGATDRDNLWQWTGDDLTEHLDRMTAAGGNYVRNTMSDRNDGDVFAYAEVEEGLYDLDEWNEEYWDRLRFFLDETAERGIIVQLTLWDRYDLATWYGRFEVHPLNPANNVNLEDDAITHMDDYYGGSIQNGNEPVLAVQHRYIDELMSVTLEYDHILYNVNNESAHAREWDDYWAEYLHDAAAERDREIHVTTMRFSPMTSVYQALTRPDLYSFAETSQNNQDALGAVGRNHYENMIRWRNIIAAHPNGPMPMNNEKVYGEGVGGNVAAGTEKEAVERFWRNIFAGAASSRFHRPAPRNGWGWGIGLSDRAEETLRSVSAFLDAFDIFRASPYFEVEMDSHSIDADYCLAIPGEAYAVYFPSGRATVFLNPWVYADAFSVRWLDVAAGNWSDEEIIEPDWDQEMDHWWGPRRVINLTPSGNGSYVALVEVVD